MTYYAELLAGGVPDSIPVEGFTFEDLYDEHIASNQKTWKQDRRLTVGASECFACARDTWFKKRGHEFGYEPDPDYEENWGAMERGNIIENHFIVPAVEKGLERRGLKLIMAGDGQDTLIDGIHSATLDGLIIPQDGGFLPPDFLEYYGVSPEEFGKQDSVVLEMKSFDPRLELTEEKPVHRGQTQMQMGLVRDLTQYKPEYAVLMYINASWLSDIHIFVIPYDESVYQIGRARNERIFEVDDPALIPWEGKLDGTAQYSAYKNACAKVSMDRVPTARKALTTKEVAAQEKDLLDTLSPLVSRRAELKKQEKQLDQDLELINEQIRVALIEKKTSRAVGDDWKVSYTAQKGRKTISKQLMIDAGLDPEDYMTEGAGFEKLTVTTAKD